MMWRLADAAARFAVAAIGLLLAAAAPGHAQTSLSGTPGYPVTLGEVLTLNLGTQGAKNDCAATAQSYNAQSLVLVVNGQTVPGARAIFSCSSTGELVGKASTSIAGNDAEAARRRSAWQTAFNGFYTLWRETPVQIGFGPAGGGLSTPTQQVLVQGANDRDLLIAANIAIVIVILFLIAFAAKFGRDPITRLDGMPAPQDIPRDIGFLKQNENYVPPYSLSRFQLLWWSAIVTASYAALVAITGSMDTVSTGTMGLMGIVGGTSILAAFQEGRPSSDSKALDAQREAYLAAAAVNPPTPASKEAMRKSAAAIYPKSAGFAEDLLTDVHGYSVHRLQLLIWTFVLGVVFAYEVSRTLGMPELSANLLALTGIANGTYFGFKTQERQVDEPPKP